eukprot:TRINITY_DN10617_c0_g3_i1.p2 TRINITY_DN10617_c0_g3~~TRINITY_DN10617_c0_g3_i1.p2  ORF type:complete len:142 (+),score=30.31 TRINITY_DN10617_c0_g3_i1:256-681(+)
MEAGTVHDPLIVTVGVCVWEVDAESVGDTLQVNDRVTDRVGLHDLEKLDETDAEPDVDGETDVDELWDGVGESVSDGEDEAELVGDSDTVADWVDTPVGEKETDNVGEALCVFSAVAVGVREDENVDVADRVVESVAVLLD